MRMKRLRTMRPLGPGLPLFYDLDIAHRYPEIRWRLHAGNVSQPVVGAAAAILIGSDRATELSRRPRAEHGCQRSKARGWSRATKTDRATARIEPINVSVEFTLPRKRNRRERFADLVVVKLLRAIAHALKHRSSRPNGTPQSQARRVLTFIQRNDSSTPGRRPEGRRSNRARGAGFDAGLPAESWQASGVLAESAEAVLAVFAAVAMVLTATPALRGR